MKICLVDDEINALDYLRELIEEEIKVLNLDKVIVYSFNKQDDFLAFIKTNSVEIIFLDIEMPQRNGVQLAKIINEDMEILIKPIIIFCTAHQEYGFEAYQINVFDYLLKPCSEERIKKTFNKLLEHKIIKETKCDSIMVDSGGLKLKINDLDILFMRAEMKYISIVTLKKTFIINDTLNNLEENYSNFIRVHRSFLVNKKYIEKMFLKENHWFLKLRNYEELIPVSRRYKTKINGKINYEEILHKD